MRLYVVIHHLKNSLIYPWAAVDISRVTVFFLADKLARQAEE